jgi:hypothetical protein
VSATTISLALEVLLSLLSKTQEISNLIRAANAEGRTDLTPDEWALVVKADDDARSRLVQAILEAKAKAAAPPATPTEAPPP